MSPKSCWQDQVRVAQLRVLLTSSILISVAGIKRPDQKQPSEERDCLA